MRKNISYIVFSLLVTMLFSCKVSSQGNYKTSNKKAIKFMDAAVDCYYQKDDKCALKNIEQAIKAEPKFGEAYLLKASIYMEQKNFAETETALLKAVEIDPKEYAEGYAALGDIYHAQFMFGKAYQAYKDYLEKGKIKKQETRLVYERKAYADFVADSLVTHPVPFEPHNMGAEINSNLSEYHPSITADGEYMIYTVLKKEGNSQCSGIRPEDGEEDFFYSTFKQDKWGNRTNIGGPLNTVCNEGAANLSPDGMFMFFYSARDRFDPNKRDPVKDIYFAKKEGNKWSVPEPLPYPVNTGSFESQPSFSSDGKTLYFTSDRPGGFGSNDIWKTTRNSDGTWTAPVNLGPTINTIGNEISPFIHPDNQTLYFASNGRYGVGGQDFYYSRINENGEFTTPKNIGYPINTPYDERSLIISADGSKGYFASKNLQGGMGEYDLYYFDLYAEARPVYTTYLKGHIFDDKTKVPLRANFELIDVETGKVIITSFSDEKTGDFLVSIPENKTYALNVNRSDYLFHSESFDMKVNENRDPFLIDIGLKQIELNTVIVLKNIFFDTDKFDLKQESTAELKKLTELLTKNPTLKIEISGHTDNKGAKAYNQTLSQNRAKAVYDYLIANGISSNRLTYKGYGDTQPIADNTTEEGRAKNRRTEFKVTGK